MQNVWIVCHHLFLLLERLLNEEGRETNVDDEEGQHDEADDGDDVGVEDAIAVEVVAEGLALVGAGGGGVHCLR